MHATNFDAVLIGCSLGFSILFRTILDVEDKLEPNTKCGGVKSSECIGARSRDELFLESLVGEGSLPFFPINGNCKLDNGSVG